MCEWGGISTAPPVDLASRGAGAYQRPWRRGREATLSHAPRFPMGSWGHCGIGVARVFVGTIASYAP